MSAFEFWLQVQQRVLLLASEGDWLLPSGDEAKRLESLLPRCYSKQLQGRSHALLQEAGIDLAKIMKVSQDWRGKG